MWLEWAAKNPDTDAGIVLITSSSRHALHLPRAFDDSIFVDPVTGIGIVPVLNFKVEF